ncbi:MAG: T9SS type A sorting domain-containing protein [Rhodothermales bacterium]
MSRILFLLPLVLGFGMVTGANAQTSNCQPALGTSILDVNNVRASIYNNGGLFWRGGAPVYEVPKGSGVSAIFASGIWLAGEVGGQLRAAATRYGPWEFWAGPLDENGNAPADCSVYDKTYKVSKADVEAYEVTGTAPPDLRGWPTGLGAPTLDANGDRIPFDINVPLASRADRVIDLAAGERPAILGDMSVWWVMNDRGNLHEATDAAPIGLEIHGLAFAFNIAGDIGNTTFYKYNMFYKGDVPLENAYLGIFSDPDLGNFDDDYVGTDTTLGLGYVYNADNDDEGGYGAAPPAAGYDFFQGPIVPSAGDSALVSGEYIQDFKNLEMTTFAFYNNGGAVNGDPSSGADYYNYMQGNWKDGQPFSFGGNGRDFSTTDTRFIFPGDPVSGEGWSEFNPDPIGQTLAPIDPADRRFVMSTGPFSINPGDQQEIVFGLVWARGSDNLDSVTKLRQADALAQSAFDVNFVLPVPPAMPEVSVTEADGQIVLEWSNSPRGNNYLESYVEFDPFGSVDDPNYEFEGYRVIQFADASDQVGRVIATYDVPNGVTRVIEDGIIGEPSFISAEGSDSGVQTFHTIPNLTNYRTYYFGVQAFAYNEPSFPKIFPSPINRFEVIPSRSTDVFSEAAVTAASSADVPDLVGDRTGVGEGRVWADVVNPASVTGESYTVEFYEIAADPGKAFENTIKPDTEAEEVDDKLTGREASTAFKTSAEGEITYDIKRGGTTIFDGSVLDGPAPLREDLIVIDGLLWSIVGPVADVKGFAAVANNAGPIEPFDMGTFAFNSNGFPMLEANGVTPEGSYPSADRPTRGVQQSTNNSAWGIATGPSGAGAGYGNAAGPFNVGDNGYVGRSIRETWSTIGADDFEWRFDQACLDAIDGTIAEGDCLAWRGFSDGELVEVPFSFWNVGLDPADTSDDYRMIPLICEAACGHPGTEFTFDIAGDIETSGGLNDPYTDWVYFYKPEDNGATPGEQGYTDFFFGTGDVGDRTFSRQVLLNWNGGEVPPYDADLPEPGTIFRYITYNPIAAGDMFALTTTGLQPRAQTVAEQELSLESIGITPNPYKGASEYERSQLIPEVRFTNLPDKATIRVFTLSGALVRTFEKNSPDRTLVWNLTTNNSLPIASGVYLIHIETDMGTKVIKFGAALQSVFLNTF